MSIVFTIGVLLVLATTALEFRAWWKSQQGTRERRWYAAVTLLNLLAAALILMGK
jgi:hypothetical protein